MVRSRVRSSWGRAFISILRCSSAESEASPAHVQEWFTLRRDTTVKAPGLARLERMLAIKFVDVALRPHSPNGEHWQLVVHAQSP
jgi:hypothetical protein